MIYLDVIGNARTGFKSVRRDGIIPRYHFLRMVFWRELAASCRERLGKNFDFGMRIIPKRRHSGEPICPRGIEHF